MDSYDLLFSTNFTREHLAREVCYENLYIFCRSTNEGKAAHAEYAAEIEEIRRTSPVRRDRMLSWEKETRIIIAEIYEKDKEEFFQRLVRRERIMKVEALHKGVEDSRKKMEDLRTTDPELYNDIHREGFRAPRNLGGNHQGDSGKEAQDCQPVAATDDIEDGLTPDEGGQVDLRIYDKRTSNGRLAHAEFAVEIEEIRAKRFPRKTRAKTKAKDIKRIIDEIRKRDEEEFYRRLQRRSDNECGCPHFV